MSWSRRCDPPYRKGFVSYSVIEADLESDRATIVGIWAANFEGGEELADRRYEWIYLRNPAGRARCWLLRHDASGAFVGAAAQFPRVFSFDGRVVRGAIGADYSVLPEHRTLLPAMKLQRVATSEGKRNGISFLYGFPAANSAPVLTRSGYKQLGMRSVLGKPLTTRGRLNRLAGPFMAGLLVPAADLVWHSYWKVRRPPVRRRVVTELLDEFDDRFDRLWDSMPGRRALLGVRNREYLNWRFKEAPYPIEYRVWTLQDAGGDLKGYIVFHTWESRVVVDDVLCLDEREYLTSLTASFGDMCRRSGHAAITVPYFGDPMLAEALRRDGFRDMPTTAQAIVSSDDPAICKPGPGAMQMWWLFASDVDV